MSRGWKLQWAPTTQETAEAAESFEYYRMDENIVLIYSNKPHDLFAEADDHFIRSMTPDEMAWLKACIDRRISEEAQKHPATVYANDMDFMEAFERELAKEKKTLERKEEMRDGYSTEEEDDSGC